MVQGPDFLVVDEVYDGEALDPLVELFDFLLDLDGADEVFPVLVLVVGWSERGVGGDDLLGVALL